MFLGRQLPGPLVHGIVCMMMCAGLAWAWSAHGEGSPGSIVEGNAIAGTGGRNGPAKGTVLGKEGRGAGEYRIAGVHGSFQARNAAQGLEVGFGACGFRLSTEGPGDRHDISLTLLGVGRDTLSFVPGIPRAQDVQDDRLDVDHGAFHMQYRNGPEGMRHDIRVEQRPPGTGPLEARLRIAGDLQALQESDDAIVFHAIDARDMKLVPRIRYSGLVAWDADGDTLPARMELRNDLVVLAVQDAGARYPITIDPLSASASTDLNGTQAGESFGFSVATAGDVNGDGYSDLLVGSPNWNTPFASAGRVQLFLGSAAGISATAAWTYQGAQVNDSLGFSVSSAGDINGDGFSDVAIGAPGRTSGRGAVLVFTGAAGGLGGAPAYTLTGNSQNGCKFGWSVALAGDVNGDGYSDLVVGAPRYNTSGAAQGKAYCYHGAAAALTLVWSFAGTAVNAQLGFSVAGVGDLNGDGYNDVAIGAPYQLKAPTGTNSGAVHLFKGSAGTGLSAAASSVQQPTSLTNANFGYCVSSAGDMNGDGYADLVAGAPGATSGNGAVYVFTGSSAAALVNVTPVSLSGTSTERLGHSVGLAGDVNGDGYADMAVGSPNHSSSRGRVQVFRGDASIVLDNAHKWTFTGATAADQMGAAVFTAGDVDGDGISDLAVGIPARGGTGAIKVLYGASDLLTASAQWSLSGTADYMNLGYCVSSAGDVNGDGYSDVLVGAPTGPSAPGTAQLFMGGPTGLSATAAWTGTGAVNGQRYGNAVASAGDVNGDGYGDVLVGAPFYQGGGDPGWAYRGRAYLYLGSASGLSAAPAWTGTGDHVEGRYGWSLSSAGDVNGDGYGDVIIGAYSYDIAATDGLGSQGKAYVYLGSAAGLSATASWTANGTALTTNFGSSVAQAGDVNGDGYDDVIIGAPYYDLGAAANHGAAYVYQGSPAGLGSTPAWSAIGEQASAFYGESVSMAGDVNGDGYSDVIVGAYMQDVPSYVQGGRAYIYHGSPTGLSAAAASTIDGTSPDSYGNAGISVCSAGDIDGDGFSDVVVGASGYSNSFSRAGAASIHRGSPTGIPSGGQFPNASAMVYGSVTNGHLGNSVALAGDVNGDGYSDLVVGASDQGTNSAGAAYLWLGNMARSLDAPMFQYRSDLATPVRTGNGTFLSGCNWGIGLLARSTVGRIKVKLAWDYHGHGPSVPVIPYFDNHGTAYLGQSAGWTDSGLSGVLIKQALTSSPSTTTSHPAWRARMRYHPATALDGRLFGRWRVQGIHDLQVPSIKTNLAACGPLPVTMLGMSVACAGGQAVVEWTTATEQDCAGFIVLRSSDGIAWEAVDTLECNSSSTTPLHYRCIDERPRMSSVTYYRIDQHDLNGAVQQFDVLALTSCDSDASVTAWPNPFEDVISFRAAPAALSGEIITVEVADMAGRNVASRNVDPSDRSIVRITDLGHLPAGAYTLLLRSSLRGVIGHTRLVRM
ncbi:MAG: FG-GAP repeat protein [Bacteroidetes bacterium]|nr:FG-GAP repeat protein [Bacteroidota bacterium]